MRSTHSATAPSPEGWTRYILQSGDITGDGRTDLVWHSPDRPWRVYTEVGAGTGFGFPDRTQHPTNLGTEFTVRLADVDGDGAQDLVWNRTISAATSRTLGVPSVMAGSRSTPRVTPTHAAAAGAAISCRLPMSTAMAAMTWSGTS
ncbi:MAG: FG-GAP repeat domain-containing protein [Longimicrobiales bacterium]